MHTSNSYTIVHSHAHITDMLPCVSCLLKQYFSFTLNLSDAAFDKFVLFAVVIFISSTGFFSSCCTYHVSKKLYIVSVEPMEIKSFSWCDCIALNHKWLKRRTNTLAEGQRVPQLSFHLLHHHLERWARSTFILQAIIYLPILSFVFQPTDNINTAHLFNRIRR